MTTYTRRHLIRDLGIVSASVAVQGALGCRKGKSSALPALTSGSLYVIIQGPWLFSVESSLHAITVDFSSLPSTDPMRHEYGYSNPRGSIPSPYTISPGQTVNFSVARSTQPPSTTTLFGQMAASFDGVFYDSQKVQLASSLPATARHLYFPYPDAILSAGRISGASFNLNGSVKSNQVADWPAALILVYSNWQSANGPGSESISPTPSQPVFRTFTIMRNVPVSQALCNAQKDDATHAAMYFQSLMTLLSFNGGASAPVPNIPVCPQPAVTIALGGDSNLQCNDLGLSNGSSSGVCQAHGPATTRGATLVNCASGGGGVVGGG
jgi:hypothetical protein